jgi:hypothetical protein
MSTCKQLPRLEFIENLLYSWPQNPKNLEITIVVPKWSEKVLSIPEIYLSIRPAQNNDNIVKITDFTNLIDDPTQDFSGFNFAVQARQ